MAVSQSISRKRRALPAVPAHQTRRKSPAVPVLSGNELHQKSSNTLALVETCWFAARALDHIPEIGTIATALGVAVKELTETHDAVEAFIDSVKP